MPYKGAGPALNDLMGGQVDLLCDQTTQTAPVIKDGNRVKVFGVTTPKRLSSMPNIPTLDEQGLKGFDVRVWHGIYAPKGTPPAVTREAQRRLARRAAGRGGQAAPGRTELGDRADGQGHARGLRSHLAAETAKWGKVIRAAGIQGE